MVREGPAGGVVAAAGAGGQVMKHLPRYQEGQAARVRALGALGVCPDL